MEAKYLGGCLLMRIDWYSNVLKQLTKSLLAGLFLGMSHTIVYAQSQSTDAGTISFEPSFFSQYNPLTALDIVDRAILSEV